MASWGAAVLACVHQLMEEEGLILGLSLAGYAMTYWLRLLKTRSTLHRVRNAPQLTVSQLPSALVEPAAATAAVTGAAVAAAGAAAAAAAADSGSGGGVAQDGCDSSGSGGGGDGDGGGWNSSAGVGREGEPGKAGKVKASESSLDLGSRRTALGTTAALGDNRSAAPADGGAVGPTTAAAVAVDTSAAALATAARGEGSSSRSRGDGGRANDRRLLPRLLPLIVRPFRRSPSLVEVASENGSSASSRGGGRQQQQQQQQQQREQQHDRLSGLVIVRGRVEAAPEGGSVLGWPRRLISGPTVLKGDKSGKRGVIVETADKVVVKDLHRWAAQIREQEVHVQRNMIPFRLSQPSSSSSSSSSVPSGSSSSSTSSSSHAPSSSSILPSLPLLSSSSSSTSPSSAAPSSALVSLEGASQPLPLLVMYTSYQRIELSWLGALSAILYGHLPVGRKVEERVLPVGEEVSAVGHVRRMSDGRFVLTASRNLPLYLTFLTKEQLVVQLSATCGELFSLGAMYTAGALAAFGFVLYRHFEYRRRRQRGRRLVQDMADAERGAARRQAAQQQPDASGGALAASADTNAANSSARDDEDEEAAEVADPSSIGNGELCVVCLVRPRRAVFSPCGHLVCCMTCARVIRSRSQHRGLAGGANDREASRPAECPVCRGHILDVVRVYRA